MTDINEGRAVDVAGQVKDLSTIERAQVENLILQLENGEFSDVNFGRLSPDKKDALNAIRSEEGVTLLVNDDLIIPANVVKKLYEKRILQDSMSPDGVANMLLNVFHREADFVSSTPHAHINAVVALRRELADMGFIGINQNTGETVIKSAYRVKKKDMGRSLEKRKTSPEGRPTPSSRAGEPSRRQPGLTDHRSGLNKQSILNVTGQVNNGIDRFAKPKPETVTPMAERITQFEAIRAAVRDYGLSMEMQELIVELEHVAVGLMQERHKKNNKAG